MKERGGESHDVASMLQPRKQNDYYYKNETVYNISVKENFL
jgi:hypothetical protein